MQTYGKKPDRPSLESAANSVHQKQERIALTDNRPKQAVQLKQYDGTWADLEKHQSEKTSGPVSGVPVQMVSYTGTWVSQEKQYQSDKVGSARISGDAEWLAIVRFCKDVPKAAGESVNDVLAKAEKIKGINFHDWKGSQKTGDSQEAQHLVSASYATKTLKLPYRLINGVMNGKMLMAGRKGKGGKVPTKYQAAKILRGKRIARGLKHIKKGIAHAGYERSMKAYIAKYYKANNLTIGKSISDLHFQALTDHLREKHKALDGNVATTDGVDDLDLS